MDEDVLFTFSNQHFVDGINEISKTMSNFTRNFNYAMDEISDSSTKASTNVKSRFGFIKNMFTRARETFSNPFRRMAETGKKALSGLAGIAGSAMKKIRGSFSRTAEFFSRNKSKIESPFNALLKKAALIGIAYAGIRKGMQQIPEIGRSFSIAGSIISRNLLWPLRRQLIPLLQKMLDWVRDNRAAFVRWGGVLVNIFIAIKGAISGVINIVRRFAESFISGVKRVLGVTANSITDLINLAIFKIAALFQFIMITLEPVADLAGEIIANLIGFFKEFFDGMMAGLGDIAGPLSDVWESFKGLLQTVGLLGERTGSLGKVFKTLGIILGTTVRLAIVSISQALDTLAFGIEKAILGIKQLKAWWEDDTKALAKLSAEQDKINKEWWEKTKKRAGDVTGTFVNTYEKIKETVTETKEEPLKKSLPLPTATRPIESKTVNQSNNINVTVTAKDKPEETGAAVGQAIRQELMDQRILAGAQ